jgi:hypothetical protein
VTAVQEVTRPKPLPTPAPTPCNSNTPSEQAPTLLPSQHITQEEPGCYDQADTPLASQHVTREGEFDCEDPANQHNVSRRHHDESSPAAQRGLEQGSRRSQHTYVEVADDSEIEQSDSSQHSAYLDGQPSASHGDDLHDQDARPNSRSLEQTATLIRYESDTSRYPSRKRKHNFEQGRDSKRPHIEATDATEVEVEVEVGSRSPGPLEPQLETDQDGRHYQQPDISETSKDIGLSITVATPPTPPQTVVGSRRSSPIPPGVDISNGGSDRFTKLSAALRAKLGMIADTVTLATVWDYLKNKRTPLSSTDDCADASEQDVSPDISSSDQRLRELKNRIVRDEKEEKSINRRRIAVRISKRIALAELIGRYIQEREARRAVPKKRRKKQLPRSSPKDRFTDLLFPETIRYKGEQLGKKEKGPRENAKKKLDYWIQLGEPLARMAQRYGIAILALLHETLTDKK